MSKGQRKHSPTFKGKVDLRLRMGKPRGSSGLPHTSGQGDALSDTLPEHLLHVLLDHPGNAADEKRLRGEGMRLGNRDHLHPRIT